VSSNFDRLADGAKISVVSGNDDDGGATSIKGPAH
jgi:hypothetical protein